jgi:hypothetical protein
VLRLRRTASDVRTARGAAAESGHGRVVSDHLVPNLARKELDMYIGLGTILIIIILILLLR